MQILKNKIIGIGLVISLLIAGGFFVLKKATNKENKQTIIVQDGGKIGSINPLPIKPNKNKYSIELYIEKNSEGKGIVFGVKCGYTF